MWPSPAHLSYAPTYFLAEMKRVQRSFTVGRFRLWRPSKDWATSKFFLIVIYYQFVSVG